MGTARALSLHEREIKNHKKTTTCLHLMKIGGKKERGLKAAIVLCATFTHVLLLRRLIGRLVGQLDEVVQLVQQLLACRVNLGGLNFRSSRSKLDF